MIERAVVLTKSKMITRKSLPPFLLAPTRSKQSPLSASGSNMSLKGQIQNYQKLAIIDALKKTKGIQKKAAKMLGIKPTTLNEMIKRLNIDLEELPD